METWETRQVLLFGMSRMEKIYWDLQKFLSYLGFGLGAVV